MVSIRSGRVVGGKVVVDDAEGLEEGAVVAVVTQEEHAPDMQLSPEQEAELEVAAQEADRGEGMDADAFFAMLKRERG